MSNPSLSRVKKKIKKDKRFKEMKANLESPRFQISFDVWTKELKFNHLQRKVAKIKMTDPNFGKKLMKAAQREVSTRSRCVEMKVLCTEIERTMKGTLSYFGDYILLTYALDLKVFGTVKERQMFVEGLLRPFKEYLDKVISLNSVIALYIEDIDKAGYALKNMTDIYITIFKNEGRIVGKNI